MNDTVFTVIFWVGLAASLFSLGLIGLTVFLWARDVWVTGPYSSYVGDPADGPVT